MEGALRTLTFGAKENVTSMDVGSGNFVLTGGSLVGHGYVSYVQFTLRKQQIKLEPRYIEAQGSRFYLLSYHFSFT